VRGMSQLLRKRELSLQEAEKATARAAERRKSNRPSGMPRVVYSVVSWLEE
jgi:hypothetical protein